MARKQIVKGLWWEPATPEKRYPGTLRYSKQAGIKLELFTTERRPLFQAGKSGWSAAHGVSHSGGRYSLFHGGVQASSSGGGELAIDHVRFNAGIEGVLEDSPPEMKVSSVTARFYGLHAWLNAKPFKIEWDVTGGLEARMHAPVMEELEFAIDGCRKLKIGWSSTGPAMNAVQRNVHMARFPECTIEYDVHVSLQQAAHDLHVFADLLSLLIGQPTLPTRLRCNSPAHTMSIGDKTVPRSFRLLRSELSLPSHLGKLNPHDVMMGHPSLQADFGAIVQKWFCLQSELWSIVGPYFNSLRMPGRFVQGKFFDMARVAEALHRELFEETILSPEEWREIHRALVEAIPEKHREALKGPLQRGNELSYKTRLQRILGLFPTLALETVGDSDDQRRFCQLVRDLRNHEAHRLRQKKQKELSGSGYLRVTSKLRVMIDALLLLQLGLSNDTIEGAMKANESYWFYASKTTWNWDE